MSSYDFNATYGPLRVYNQRTYGSCWSHSMGLAICASTLMHTGRQPGWVDDGESYPRFNYVITDDWVSSHYECQIESKTHSILGISQRRTAGSADDSRELFDWSDPDVMKPYLDDAGLILAGTRITKSFNVWAAASLPVVRPLPEDDPTAPGHAVLGVGYTDDGLIIQNSWGDMYGHYGRAVVSWEWLGLYADSMEKAKIDDYPLLGATRPPQPLPTRKKNDMLLARRTPTSPVWAFTGGVRSWISTWAILTPQGYTSADVKVIPGTDVLWTNKVAIVGPLPPGGDA